MGLVPETHVTLQRSSGYDDRLPEGRDWDIRPRAERSAALDGTCHDQQQRGSISIGLECSFFGVCFCAFSPGDSAIVT